MGEFNGASSLKISPTCHFALPADWGHMGDEVLLQLSNEKARQQIDFFVFALDGDIEATRRSVESIVAQTHKPRKITIASNPGSWSKYQPLTKNIPEGIYWEVRFGLSEVAESNLLGSDFFYTSLNESLKLNAARKPPRPHWISVALAGYEYPPDFSRSLQERIDGFQPFLVMRPSSGWNGLTVSRRLYGGLNGERSDFLLKLERAKELSGRFPMFHVFEADGPQRGLE